MCADDTTIAADEADLRPERSAVEVLTEATELLEGIEQHQAALTFVKAALQLLQPMKAQGISWHHSPT